LRELLLWTSAYEWERPTAHLQSYSPRPGYDHCISSPSVLRLQDVREPIPMQ
jgi:hypothetical protein